MSLLHNICILLIQGRTDELVVMETRKPKWNDKLDAWTMDFKGDLGTPATRHKAPITYHTGSTIF